jgi:lipopolysaccharide transport protein LptA
VLRLRLLRLILPLLLVLLGLLLWANWNPRPASHREPPTTEAPDNTQAENLSVVQFGEETDSELQIRQVDSLVHGENNSLHVEGVQDLTIHREGRGPLLISAAVGDRTGDVGEQVWQFREQVVFREVDNDLRLVLPVLTIDEGEGIARSEGDIRFDAPSLSGRTESLTYGLIGQPTEMAPVELRDLEGGTLTALEGRLRDGVRDVELLGEVRASRPGQWMESDGMRLLRDADGRLRLVKAEGAVRGAWAPDAGTASEIAGDRLELRWGPLAAVDFVGLQGGALISRADERLTAMKIEAVRDYDGIPSWKVMAAGDVFVDGRFSGTRGRLRTERLMATLDHDFLVQSAEGEGDVRFEGDNLRAEGERGLFAVKAGAATSVELFGTERRKAYLAQGRTRVAARTIRTDADGEQLEAEGLVEATLLPAAEGEQGEQRGAQLFLAGQAIHFVSEQFSSVDTGAVLTFNGAARGWQGERNLAADEVIVDQRKNTLVADGNVSTRFPRQRETGAAAAGAAEYIQIGGAHLDYDDAGGLAVYTGSVRVRLVEGWLDAERVEVELAADSREVREIRASSSVRIEFERTSADAMALPIAGTADRLVYRPDEATVKLFGDTQPAAVRRIGEGGGTTTGRELHYRVDTGALSVESGEQGSGRIRS